MDCTERHFTVQMSKGMREIWKIMFGVADGIVLAPACVAAVFGVCYVGLAFGEQDFNEEMKLGETEERSK